MAVISDNQTDYAFTKSDFYLIITKTGTLIDPDVSNIISGSVDEQDERYYVFNYGVVQGAIGIEPIQSTMSIVNDLDGRISGYEYGIDLYESDTNVRNLGSVTCADRQAISVTGGHAVIENTGTIAGQLGIYMDTQGGADVITNTGVVAGDSIAIYKEGGGSLDLTNTGTIAGNLILVDGTNTYDGRNGTISGLVHGGSGRDLIIAGNDGETVRGGGGADTITAGVGADTITLTHLSASDVDHIHRFAASQDTFQVEHASFGQLTRGKPVVFATGVKATSAADHLFYNATSGVLFYDADGSGTKSAARAVAQLDPGLHLTARNFEVV